MRRPLTAVAISKLKKPGRYAVGNGVYLQITGERGRSWVFRFEQQYGDERRGRHIGLGPCALVSLAEAREKGLEYRKLLLKGVDPLNHKKALRQQAMEAAARAVTFRYCAEQYVAAHEAGWGNAVHRKQWISTLEAHVYPVIGMLPVGSVDTALVVAILEPIWTVKPQTASRVRGRIESILDWARVRGYRGGENPARWRGHLDHLLPTHRRIARVKHHPALPFADVPAFMCDLRMRDESTARALEFMILTASRVSEVLGAKWNEISGDVWTVPAGRMKGRRDHRVPLSTDAGRLLEGLPRNSEYVFPGKRHQIPNNGPRKLLRRMGRGDITVHGFRSSFRDWAAETTGFANHVVEMALAHAIGSGVEAAYRRGDLFEKRRRLMQNWAHYCSQPRAASDVVPLRTSA